MATKTKKVSSLPPTRSSNFPVTNSVVTEKRRPVVETNLILGVLLVIASFLVGRLSAQVESLKGGSVAAAPAPAAAGQPAAPAATPFSVDNLKKDAKGLGVNTGQFNSCLDSGKYANKVADDVKAGQALGVSGTPTFFINGLMLVGAQPQISFEKIIDAELKDGSGDKALTADEAGGTVVRKQMAYGVGNVAGNKNAKIKIVEYTDFECPYCARSFPTVKAILDKYGDKVSLETRNFPLSFHQYAQKAAEAYECAGEQGKFTQMHDLLFTKDRGNG